MGMWPIDRERDCCIFQFEFSPYKPRLLRKEKENRIHTNVKNN